jgi:hypothetical protein
MGKLTACLETITLSDSHISLLRISNQQLAAFDDVAESLLIRKLATTLRERHGECLVRLPDAVRTVEQFDDNALRELVRNALARAKGHGLTFESSLASFVILMFETAPNFDEHPLLNRTLGDEDVAPDERINQLLDEATDQNWDAARERYDPAAWGLKSAKANPEAKGDER